MDAQQLIKTFKRNGCFDDKAKTQTGSYTTASYSNFITQQVGNRSSSSWKIAQYIIDSCFMLIVSCVYCHFYRTTTSFCTLSPHE